MLLIDPTKCRKDGICIAECPFRLLDDGGDGVPVPRRAAPKICIRCGHCVAVCPASAISLEGMGPQDCAPIRPEDALSPDQAEQFLRTRRSIRTFRDKPVPRKMLERLLRTAAYAPSAKNHQPTHWTILEKREDVHALAALVIDWMRREKLFPGLVRAFAQGKDQLLHGAPHLLVAHAPEDAPGADETVVADCTLAAAYLELAAHANDLGACWAGFVITAAKHDPAVGAFLDLPQGHKVHAALMLGYAKFRYRRIPTRRAPKIAWKA